MSSSIFQGDNHNMDSYMTVSYRKDSGYFERIGGSCMGIFIGLLVLLAAFPILFFNEVIHFVTISSLVIFSKFHLFFKKEN